MNIFATSSCPYESARNLDDKRVVKMVLETAQIMSTVIHKYDPEFYAASSKLYRPTHANHPCVNWAAEHITHFYWLFHHFRALLNEYNDRYNRMHKSGELNKTFYDFIEQHGFEYEDPTYFPNCARNKELGIDYTNINDVHLAYQLYLADRWENDKRTPTWYGVGR